VEIFDRCNVTFVSITQSFNTTTSMGRLTLNVLLSFAQYERETTADRIRDKYAESLRKGLWMGGCPPLGYDIQNRELVVNPAEAEQVRHIFRRFAETGSPTQVVNELRQGGFHNKTWKTTEGALRQGRFLNKVALYRILKNRVYLGEAAYKDEIHPGRHQAIVERGIWEQVHALIAEHRQPNSNLPRGQTPFPLKGLVRCGHCGVAMRPSHTLKAGQVQYRYYLCTNAAKNSHSVCPMPNVPAAELERVVLDRIRKLLKAPEMVARAIRKVRKADPDMPEREIIDLLSQLDPIWEELFPLEQNRIISLLVKSITMTPQGADLRLRMEGLNTLVNELAVNDEEKSA